MIKIEVNNKTVTAQQGETILSALKRNGIIVPTICSMEDLSPTGACRMCVVEVEGMEHLIPACSYPVKEWMKIKTHSPRVLTARKTNVELLLSNHPDDCLYCERNGNCELQKLSEDLNVRSRKIQGQAGTFKIDNSSHGIVRDPAKCILCGRCVRTCEEIIGVSAIDFIRRGDALQISTALSEPLQFSSCIDCGQCVVSCPTGALIDKQQYQELTHSFNDPEKSVVVQYTPEVAVSLADEFGMKSGSNLKGIIHTALRKIGFDYVFETAFGGDIYIMEQAAEFKRRFEQQENLPLISSRCPSTVNYLEKFSADLRGNLLHTRSPHQVVGKLIKGWFAEEHKLKLNRIHSVLITNCTGAKQEATLPHFQTSNTPDIDFVLTTRELARLIRLNGIDLEHLEPEASDGPFLSFTSAGELMGNAGGEMEATLRTLFREFNKKEMSDPKISRLRGGKPERSVRIKIPKGEIHAMAVNGLSHAIQVLDQIKAGKIKVDILEIMACPEGCVNGGGQPIPSAPEIIKARSRAIYDVDKSHGLKMAHQNPSVLKMYKDFSRGPGSDHSRELFFHKFEERSVLK